MIDSEIESLTSQRNSKPKVCFDKYVILSKYSRILNYEKGIGYADLGQAICSWRLGNYELATNTLTSTLNFATTHDLNFLEVNTLKFLGSINMEFDSYDRAIDYFQSGLYLARKQEFSSLIACFYNNIGEVYRELSAYDDAIAYYQRLYKFATIHNLTSYIGLAKINLALVNINSGNLEVAQRYLLDIKTALDQISNPEDLYYYYMTYAEFLRVGNTGQTPVSYYNEAYLIADKYKLYDLMIETLVEMSKYYALLSDFETALKSILIAYDMAEESNIDYRKYKLTSYLATIYEKLGDFEASLKYFKLFHKNKTTLENNLQNQALKNIRRQNTVLKENQSSKLMKLQNTELARRTEKLQSKYKDIATINGIGKDLTSSLDLTEILTILYQKLKTLMSSSHFAIALIDDAQEFINYVIYKKLDSDLDPPKIAINDNAYMSTWVYRNKKPIFITNFLEEHKLYMTDISIKNNIDGKLVNSLIFVPIILKSKVIGIMTVQDFRRDAFTDYHLNLIEVLSSYLAIAISNSQESEKLSKEIMERKNIEMKLLLANRKLESLSLKDYLTDLPNRRNFMYDINKEWTIARKNHTEIAILLLDVDYFKEYNDNYGHVKGDDCLIHIGNTLKNVLNTANGKLARIGGDEFVMIISNTNAKDTSTTAGEIIKAVNTNTLAHAFSPIEDHVTLSIGAIVIKPDTVLNTDHILSLADEALYLAKNKGRNQYACKQF